MHRVDYAEGCFSLKKTQVCRSKVIILDQKYTNEGRILDQDKVLKIKN